MCPRHSRHAPPPPAAGNEAGPGEAGAPAREDGAHPSAKYGREQLEALYEISKLLTTFGETTEETVLALVGIINRELPLRSAVFIEKAPGRPETIVWPSPGLNEADLRLAVVRAMKSFAFLTQTVEPEVAPAGAEDVPALAGEQAPRPVERERQTSRCRPQ